MVEVKNLTKFYGSIKAVDDISFTVETGEVLGFLGPNGAGKSTTMNMITGYLSSTSGTVTIDGCEILDDPIHAKSKIGYLPEIPPLYIDMTVKKYLEFMFDLKKVKLPKKEHIDEVMRLTKITEQADRIIKHLSKGYRQRVGLAQALLGNPPVIILDEPTVGLDPKQIIEIRKLIRNLGKKHTVIFSSHVLSEVSEVCDRIVVISKGKIVADAQRQCKEIVGQIKDMLNSDVTDKSLFEARALAKQLNNAMPEEEKEDDYVFTGDKLNFDDIKKGVSAYCPKINSTVTVAEVKSPSKIIVRAGNITMNVTADDLYYFKQDKKKPLLTHSRTAHRQVDSRSYSNEINVIGQTVDEAVQNVDEFIDYVDKTRNIYKTSPFVIAFGEKAIQIPYSEDICTEIFDFLCLLDENYLCPELYEDDECDDEDDEYDDIPNYEHEPLVERDFEG